METFEPITDENSIEIWGLYFYDPKPYNTFTIYLLPYMFKIFFSRASVVGEHTWMLHVPSLELTLIIT